MSRVSSNEYKDGLLWRGFDYTRQAWVNEGRYVRCGHPESMNSGCYGRPHEGQACLERSECAHEKEEPCGSLQ